jgi:hypothetical protein
MKITLKQAGGIAAAIRRAPLVLDTAALDASRGEIEGLARAVAVQPMAAAAAHPDEMAYTLTIEDSEGAHEVRSLEHSASPEFGRLVAEVRRRGKVADV